MGRSRARMFGAVDAVEQPPRRACEMAGAQFVIPRHVGKPSPDTNKRLRLTHTHVLFIGIVCLCVLPYALTFGIYYPREHVRA